MSEVIWITGLSGAGKTTIGQMLVERLRFRGRSVVFLDGDILREVFIGVVPSADSHSKTSRLQLAIMYSRLCSMLAKQGVSVVIATVSLYREVHVWNRENIQGYFEVYLKVPIDELRRRDPKGIYRRFSAGEICNVAGLDLDIDEPENPDLLVEHNSTKSIIETVDEIYRRIGGTK